MCTLQSGFLPGKNPQNSCLSVFSPGLEAFSTRFRAFAVGAPNLILFARAEIGLHRSWSPIAVIALATSICGQSDLALGDRGTPGIPLGGPFGGALPADPSRRPQSARRRLHAAPADEGRGFGQRHELDQRLRGAGNGQDDVDLLHADLGPDRPPATTLHEPV